VKKDQMEKRGGVLFLLYWAPEFVWEALARKTADAKWNTA